MFVGSAAVLARSGRPSLRDPWAAGSWNCSLTVGSTLRELIGDPRRIILVGRWDALAHQLLIEEGQGADGDMAVGCHSCQGDAQGGAGDPVVDRHRSGSRVARDADVPLMLQPGPAGEHANGAALLRAVALGYDIGTRINMSLNAYEFREDGHSTHSFGPMFGAAAAAAALCRFDQRQARHLLSYTSQQASGVSCWMRDAEHIEKSFDFGGMPARNGVTSASMVAHGFTGVDDIFAGERNFFVAYGRKPDLKELVRGLGSTFEIMNTNIKRWSVGSPIQAPLDSLLDLIETHGIKAADVEKLVVRVAHQGANTVDNRHMPDICMQHMCAVMLLDSTVTFKSSHDEKRMRDPKVLALRKRIQLFGDDALSKVMPSRQGIVELTLKGGRTLRHHTKAVRGTSDNPMTRKEVDTKSYDLLAPILGKARARKLCDAIWSLDKLNDVRKLRALLVA